MVLQSFYVKYAALISGILGGKGTSLATFYIIQMEKEDQ